MELTFAPRGILQIDDADITYRNFRGEGSLYNREGDRNFSLIIPSTEIADALASNVNEYGVGWNVRIKPPREEGDNPFITLKVNVKFNEYRPHIFLHTGNHVTELDEESVSCLDMIDIERVDLDISPSDRVVNGKPYRTAYVRTMHVVQKIDRFEGRYSNNNEE